MKTIKSFNNQIKLDFIMIPISIYMTYDYASLVAAGDDSLRRKIVLAIWIFSIFGWSYKLVRDLRTKKKLEDQNENQNT